MGLAGVTVMKDFVEKDVKLENPTVKGLFSILMNQDNVGALVISNGPFPLM